VQSPKLIIHVGPGFSPDDTVTPANTAFARAKARAHMIFKMGGALFDSNVLAQNRVNRWF